MYDQRNQYAIFGLSILAISLLITLIWINPPSVQASPQVTPDQNDVWLPIIFGDGEASVPTLQNPSIATPTATPSATATPVPTETALPMATATNTQTPQLSPTTESTVPPTSTVTPTPDTSARNPILFVSQIPIRPDFTTIGSTFGNHLASIHSVGRGGDLWILYPDGTMKNLTAAAGYGLPEIDSEISDFQGANAIAVRDPAVHWDGQKAIFSMVIGAPTEQYVWESYYWQLYEIIGLGPDDTPVITRVANQPENYNNISPIYGTDDRIIFTTDRPRNGARHLYPQLDEYELSPTNTGLWSLDPETGDLRLLNHAPSGNFTPLIDSFGRVLFTQWDHLQRDQQADADNNAANNGSALPYNTFNYADESEDAAILNDRSEVFPEPRRGAVDLPEGVVGLRFNHFFPWEINEDGTESEILNHLGRHELHDYFANSISTDSNVDEFIAETTGRTNPNAIENMFHIEEDPLTPGRYYGIDAPEFNTHSSGMVIRLHAPSTENPDHIVVDYITHPDTITNQATENHSGHYREPLPLSDGTLIAVHTAQTADEASSGDSIYDFRLTTLTQNSNGYWTASQHLTQGISKTVRYWNPDVLITYAGPLWELNPVEVRARPRPTRRTVELSAPEQQAFSNANVNPNDLRTYLTDNNLALVVSRNVTVRDDLDTQQPYNLRVASNNAQDTETIGSTGTVYDISYLQFFQGDQIRGWYAGRDEPRAGRRVLAQAMHDANALTANPPTAGPAGSTVIAPDGSMAAFVPANRAMSWQLTDASGNAIVRERYWLTFQPGEIRTCSNCHGLNEQDQAGQTEPMNTPLALIELLEEWSNK